MPDTPRVFVTGAGGALGGAVVRHVLRQGWQVRASLGPPGEPPKRPTPRAVVATHVDVRDEAGLRAAMQGAEAVIHVAGPPSVAASFAEPERYRSVHVDGTLAVAAAAASVGARRLVHVSSAEVYAGGVVGEDDDLDPRSPYAVCKVAAETALRERADELAVAIVRPFLIVDDLPPRGVLGVVARQLDDRVIGLSDPDVVRDFVWVDDVADVLARAAVAPQTDPVACFNAGSGVGTSVGDFAAAIGHAHGGPREVRRAPRRAGPLAPLPELVADMRHTTATLHHTPTLRGLDLARHVARALRRAS